jgi:hypothetical protein
MNAEGVAALITAVTGVLSLAMTLVVLLRTGHIINLTNANFKRMQEELRKAVEYERGIVSDDR